MLQVMFPPVKNSIKTGDGLIITRQNISTIPGLLGLQEEAGLLYLSLPPILYTAVGHYGQDRGSHVQD